MELPQTQARSAAISAWISFPQMEQPSITISLTLEAPAFRSLGIVSIMTRWRHFLGRYRDRKCTARKVIHTLQWLLHLSCGTITGLTIYLRRWVTIISWPVPTRSITPTRMLLISLWSI